ncbi:hypothetical protein DH09_16970 [Bacillaceae bacterium JMAK1]|nr:hypothetical protein DH09_16970 [Bacillaceae bacterium JMAK1]
MKSNYAILIGVISIIIGLALFLYVLFYYPVGDESSWGGLGFLVASVFFGVLGLIVDAQLLLEIDPNEHVTYNSSFFVEDMHGDEKVLVVDALDELEKGEIYSFDLLTYKFPWSLFMNDEVEVIRDSYSN